MGTDARPDGGQWGQEGAAAGRTSAVEPAALRAEETPVGRLAEVGSAALSVRELLALLLRARGTGKSHCGLRAAHHEVPLHRASRPGRSARADSRGRPVALKDDQVHLNFRITAGALAGSSREAPGSTGKTSSPNDEGHVQVVIRLRRPIVGVNDRVVLAAIRSRGPDAPPDREVPARAVVEPALPRMQHGDEEGVVRGAAPGEEQQGVGHGLVASQQVPKTLRPDCDGRPDPPKGVQIEGETQHSLIFRHHPLARSQDLSQSLQIGFLRPQFILNPALALFKSADQ
jgi:hypothetical protein